jgi:putative two-component system response regulator
MNKIKVLAVDDDIINLKLLKSILLKLPIVEEVVEAKNGADALGILKSQGDIDLVLLDIIMPVMNGIEMLKVIRADEDLKTIPVIVLTTDETKKSEALECGANDFIMKPVREKNVSEKIARLSNL